MHREPAPSAGGGCSSDVSSRCCDQSVRGQGGHLRCFFQVATKPGRDEGSRQPPVLLNQGNQLLGGTTSSARQVKKRLQLLRFPPRFPATFSRLRRCRKTARRKKLRTRGVCLFYEFISKCKLHYSMHTSYDNIHYSTICYFSYLHRTWSQYIV